MCTWLWRQCSGLIEPIDFLLVFTIAHNSNLRLTNKIGKAQAMSSHIVLGPTLKDTEADFGIDLPLAAITGMFSIWGWSDYIIWLDQSPWFQRSCSVKGAAMEYWAETHNSQWEQADQGASPTCFTLTIKLYFKLSSSSCCKICKPCWFHLSVLT